MSSTLSSYKQPPNKEKRKANEEHRTNLKNKKRVIEQESASKNHNKGKEISVIEEPEAIHDKKKKPMMEEDPNANEDSKYPKIFGVLLKPLKGSEKGTYPCALCRKIFLTPQSLGGHHNKHRWEQSIKQRKERIESFQAKNGPYNFPSSSLALPSYQGDGTFQIAGTPSFNDNNTIHHSPPINSFSKCYFMSFLRANETLRDNNAFQYPVSSRFNYGFATNYYGMVENISRLSRQMNEAKETQLFGISGFEFGLHANRNGEDTNNQQDEELSFKL